jgi:hypothetical protein
MIKYGIVTEDSISDFNIKKAEYYDAEGFAIADRDNKDKLKKPVKIAEEKEEETKQR